MSAGWESHPFGAPSQDSAGPGGPAPRWLEAALWAVVALAAAQAACEVFALRPGYGVGDETDLIRRLVGTDPAHVMEFAWTRGCLQSWSLKLWLGLSGKSLGALHLPALLALALEGILLWRLARRWFGGEAAAWAVIADFACSATWMRARSVLSHAWLPMELLALALLAGRVRRRRGAIFWGLAATALLFDYEGALVALPGLILACLALEPAFRRHAAAVLTAMALGAAALIVWQAATIQEYVRLRQAVNLGEGHGAVLHAWGLSLWQLLAGGHPVPYLGVDDWPAVAAWTLPALAWGVPESLRLRRASLLLWALWAVLVTQGGTAPWGLPSQRLVAAWPPLLLLTGAGAAALRRRLPSVPSAAWMAFLALGLGLEANAFYRHMALHGRQVYGRAELLDEACSDARSAAATDGPAVCTALMELRSSDIRFFIDPSPARTPAAGAWVFLPPEFRAAASAAGGARVYRRSANDVPVLVMRIQGPAASRFEAVEADLRPLLQKGGSQDEAAWLERPAWGDPWAYDAVLDRHLKRLWRGLPLDRELLDRALARPPVTPGPMDLLGRFLISTDPASALRFLDRALAVDPWWGPALEDRAEALARAGRSREAAAAADLRDERFRQGAWQVYD